MPSSMGRLKRRICTSFNCVELSFSASAACRLSTMIFLYVSLFTVRLKLKWALFSLPAISETEFSVADFFRLPEWVLNFVTDGHRNHPGSACLNECSRKETAYHRGDLTDKKCFLFFVHIHVGAACMKFQVIHDHILSRKTDNTTDRVK